MSSDAEHSWHTGYFPPPLPHAQPDSLLGIEPG